MSDIHTNDLPVTLTFMVGTAQIALADVLNLTNGVVIEGEAVNTFFPKVRAVLGERTIAEGELVKVDQRVAFRVTKVL